MRLPNQSAAAATRILIMHNLNFEFQNSLKESKSLSQPWKLTSSSDKVFAPTEYLYQDILQQTVRRRSMPNSKQELAGFSRSICGEEAADCRCANRERCEQARNSEERSKEEEEEEEEQLSESTCWE